MIKALLLISALAVIPTFALADSDDDDDDDDDYDDVRPAIPEPSGALVISVALTTVTPVTRRQPE